MGFRLERRENDDRFDWQALLHPAGAFAHPSDVVRDADLTLNEKRAILASWASDACAVESAPALRARADGPVVRFDDVMDALRILDKEQGPSVATRPHYRRVLSKRVAGVFGKREKPEPRAQ